MLEVRLKSERWIYFDLLYLQEVKESIDAFEASLRAVIPPASPIGFEGWVSLETIKSCASTDIKPVIFFPAKGISINGKVSDRAFSNASILIE